MIAEGLLERVEDFTFDGRKVLASRLGYRITALFVDRFLGRLFETPDAVFSEEMLRPEKQGLELFAAGVDAIVEAQRRVALNYFEDGSVEAACPPLKALLHIMAQGEYEGMGLDDPRLRGLFEREAVLESELVSGAAARASRSAISRCGSAIWRRSSSFRVQVYDGFFGCRLRCAGPRSRCATSNLPVSALPRTLPNYGRPTTIRSWNSVPVTDQEDQVSRGTLRSRGLRRRGRNSSSGRMPLWMRRRLSGRLLRQDIDRNMQAMASAADQDTLDRSDIAVIAAPGNGDVPVRGHQAIGRIEIDPAGRRHKNADPGVRNIRARQSRLAGRRSGHEIAAHVAGSQSQGTQAANLEMREVLANAPAGAEHFEHRRAHVGRAWQKLEFVVDSFGQVHDAIQKGPAFREGGLGVGRQFGGSSHVRGVKAELAGAQRFGFQRVLQQFADLFPRRTLAQVDARGRTHLDFTLGGDGQVMMRFLEAKVVAVISEIIQSFAARRRAGHDCQSMPQAGLQAVVSRPQADDVVRKRHGLRVVIARRVRDAVSQRLPALILANGPRYRGVREIQMRDGIGKLRGLAEDLGQEVRQVLLRLLREHFAPLRQMRRLDRRAQSQEQLLVVAAVGMAGVARQRGEVLGDGRQLECDRARIALLRRAADRLPRASRIASDICADRGRSSR